MQFIINCQPTIVNLFMNLPFFYEAFLPADESFILSEDTSKHIIQVLRMKKGDEFKLTNGKGDTYLVCITSEHKKATEVSVISKSHIPQSDTKITIAISLIKNPGRFEWFLEKATEIGINEIIPLICDRTEKLHFRCDRMNSILLSAMLQSQQAWLPVLHEPVKYGLVIKSASHQQRFIAHCVGQEKKLLHEHITRTSDKIILIGPEGDFTKQEIDLAVENNFIPVSLGKTRLRTETAGMVAATIMKLCL